MGRWQLLQKNPTVICDTGHNLDGIILSMQQLKTQKYKRLHIVWGMVSDKETKKISQRFLNHLKDFAVFAF